MPVAIPPLLLLAALIVALGLITFARALVELLFWVARQTIGRLPWLGDKLDAAILRAMQATSNFFGRAADGVAGEMSKAWNTLAAIITSAARSLYELALTVERLVYHATDWRNIAKWVIRTDPFVNVFRAFDAAIKAIRHPVTNINKYLVNPVASPLGAAVRVVVRIDKIALSRFSKWTRAQLRALEAQIAHAGAAVLPWPGTISGEAWERIRGLGRRVAKIERGALPYLAAGVFVATLARFGLGWLRCRNVKKVGRSVCGTHPDLLDAILAETTVIFGAISLVQLARELSAIEPAIATAIAAGIRETKGL